MGASESRSHQEADDATAAQDYYAILEVDEDASADEIRVSSYLTRTRRVPWRHLIIALRHDSVPSAALHSFIIRTKIMTTLKVRPDVLPRCSRRMRCVCPVFTSDFVRIVRGKPFHLILDNLSPR